MAYKNGKIPTAELGVISGGHLQKAAATSWNEMVKAAKKDGVTLASAGAYRPYDDPYKYSQVEIFKDRYTKQATGSGPYGDVRRWNGVRYVRTSGAAAAPPGTSNHGWGLAIDVANAFYAYGKTPGKIVSWLNKNAGKYGWVRRSWTFVKNTWEPWHWEYEASKDTKPWKPKALVTVDGIWGTATTKALQKQLGVTADGVLGPKTIRALQKAVGAKQDGIWGVNTTKALQKHLNKWISAKKITGSTLKVDGVKGVATNRAVQRAINKKLW